MEEANNYSSYNNNGREKNDYIKTNFSKVRLISIRNKNGAMVDKIDISDFRFATGNKKFKIEVINNNHIFVDAAPYAVAMNNNITFMSQFKTDIRP